MASTAGARSFNWIKLKRGYQAELADTIDCVLVGYLYGRGAARALLGSARSSPLSMMRKRDRFQTVAKIGSGLPDEGWVKMRELLDQDAVPHRPARGSVLQPDVWCEPHYVVEVQADEITRSPLHAAGRDGEPTGYALRFPRHGRLDPHRQTPRRTRLPWRRSSRDIPHPAAAGNLSLRLNPSAASARRRADGYVRQRLGILGSVAIEPEEVRLQFLFQGGRRGQRQLHPGVIPPGTLAEGKEDLQVLARVGSAIGRRRILGDGAMEADQSSIRATSSSSAAP